MSHFKINSLSYKTLSAIVISVGILSAPVLANNGRGIGASDAGDNGMANASEMGLQNRSRSQGPNSANDVGIMRSGYGAFNAFFKASPKADSMPSNSVFGRVEAYLNAIDSNRIVPNYSQIADALEKVIHRPVTEAQIQVINDGLSVYENDGFYALLSSNNIAGNYTSFRPTH